MAETQFVSRDEDEARLPHEIMRREGLHHDEENMHRACSRTRLSSDNFTAQADKSVI
jgi:hypothetical protein